MTDPTNPTPPDRETRRREAERVARERKDDLPSQRDTESAEGGRPSRGTEWERRGPTPPAE
jgi:hypothetical protein